MRHLAKIIILTFCLVLFSTSVEAQKFKKKSKYLSIGLSAGTMNYVGELDPAPSFLATSLKFTRWNIGGVFSKRVHPRATARATLNYGRIQGDDAISATDIEGFDIYRKARNLNFRNDIIEIKFDGVFDLFQNRRGIEKRAHITPYGFLGVSFFYHNPKGRLDGKWIALQPLGTEGQYLDGVGEEKPYSKLQIAIPFGVGVRYKIGVLWDVAFQIGLRKTFTDYLDDVSGNYVDKALFDPGSDVFKLSDPSLILEDNRIRSYEKDGLVYTRGYGDGVSPRGDNGSKDWFIVTGFHVTYIFHPKLIAPKFKG